jgi:hypothetical protein
MSLCVPVPAQSERFGTNSAKAIRVYERDVPFPLKEIEETTPEFVTELYLQRPIGVFQFGFDKSP